MKKILTIAVIFIASIALFSFTLQNKDNSAENDLKKIQETNSDVDTSVDKEISVSSKLTTTELPKNPNVNVVFDVNNLEDIYFAGGSFWGLEAYMSRVVGVYDVTTGYANGESENPSYEDVLYKNSGHAQTVHIQYDPSIVNVETLMAYYLKVIDPTGLNQQGRDIGSQYRRGIYYTNYEVSITLQRVLYKEQELYDEDIVVEVEPLRHFVLAEEYHQDYLEKNPTAYSHINLKDVEENLSVFIKASDDELKARLSSLEYQVTQEYGTERPYVNEYWDSYEDGIYVDITTGQPLFSSLDKYDSETGWPSFTKPIADSVVTEVLYEPYDDYGLEVRSLIGDSHLGHIFNDGPKDQGGLRYCLNSASLKFIPYGELEEMGYGYLEYLFE